MAKKRRIVTNDRVVHAKEPDMFGTCQNMSFRQNRGAVSFYLVKWDGGIAQWIEAKLVRKL